MKYHTATARELLRNPWLHAAERSRLCHLARITLRPRMSDHDRHALARLVAHPHWQPVTPSPPLRMVLPLLVQNTLTAGIQPETVFKPGRADALPDEHDFRRFGLESLKRRHAIEKACAALDSAGVTTALLIKGEALAPKFEAPALRLMTDTDIVIHESDSTRVHSALRSCGFTPGPSNLPGTWVHGPSNAMIDLLTPAHPAGHRIMERAHLVGDARMPPCVRIPQPADHLLIVALHSAKHTGDRIWRDILDLRAILLAEDQAHILREAFEFAALHNLTTPLRGVLSFAADVFGPLGEDSTHPTRETELVRELCRRMAFLAFPPTVLRMIRRTRPRSWSPAAIARRIHQRASQGTLPVSEADFGLGDVPATLAARARFKLAIAIALATSGNALELTHLMRLQKTAFRLAPELFTSVTSP